MQLTVVGGELDCTSTNNIGRKFADELVVTALNLKGKVCILTSHVNKLIINNEGTRFNREKVTTCLHFSVHSTLCSASCKIFTISPSVNFDDMSVLVKVT